jgi:uncharacterized protein YuzE
MVGTRVKIGDFHMKLTYDPQYNVAYIQLRRKSGKVKTVQVSDELNVDLAADGTIYGIELLNANEQLAKGKGLVLENLRTGRREKLSLAS